jgi:hypothetical protein
MLIEIIAYAQEGYLEALMFLYSSYGVSLARAVGLPHRFVLDLALED